jgi:hypothetical protein
MFKVMLIAKRKAGYSKQQFIDYYETRHAPLIRRHFADYMLDYQRNFLVHGDPNAVPAPPGGGEAEFDVITEILIQDRATLEAMFAKAAEPAIAAQVAEDANTFIERASVRRFVTEVYP